MGNLESFQHFLPQETLLTKRKKRKQDIFQNLLSGDICGERIMKLFVVSVATVALILTSKICCEAAVVMDAVAAAAVDDVAAAAVDEELMAEKRWDGTKATGQECTKSSECRVGRCMWHRWAE